MASVVIRSEGQRLLLEVPGTVTEIAAQLGMMDTGLVHMWCEGTTVPGPHKRTRLNVVYGIPPRSWRELPRHGPPPAQPTPAPAPAPNDTLAHCVELLTMLRNERTAPGTLARDRMKLAAAESKVLMMRHQLEQRAELLEDRYVREHPAFKRHVALIVAALRDHPVAAKAVLHALQTGGMKP